MNTMNNQMMQKEIERLTAQRDRYGRAIERLTKNADDDQRVQSELFDAIEQKKHEIAQIASERDAALHDLDELLSLMHNDPGVSADAYHRALECFGVVPEGDITVPNGDAAQELRNENKALKRERDAALLVIDELVAIMGAIGGALTCIEDEPVATCKVCGQPMIDGGIYHGYQFWLCAQHGVQERMVSAPLPFEETPEPESEHAPDTKNKSCPKCGELMNNVGVFNSVLKLIKIAHWCDMCGIEITESASDATHEPSGLTPLSASKMLRVDAETMVPEPLPNSYYSNGVKCNFCNRVMVDRSVKTCAGNTFVEFPDGTKMDSVKYDLDISESERANHRCHDCGIAIGGYHHPGCDMEVCPKCGGQLISCGCLDNAITFDDIIGQW